MPLTSIRYIVTPGLQMNYIRLSKKMLNLEKKRPFKNMCVGKIDNFYSQQFYLG